MTINDKRARQLGFWSAVSAAAMILWFSIAFGLYQPVLHAPWPGMQAYTDAFRVGPFIAWIIPCLFLPFFFLILMASLHTLTSEENKIWSLLALVFAIAYATLLSACYYIQIVVVGYNLVHHSTEGLRLWLFASPYPHSIPGALEGIGYAFMSLSFIFASRHFSGDKLRKWTSRSFLFSGLTGFVVFTDPVFPLPLPITLIVACANAVILSAALILAAVWFKRSRKNCG